MPNKEMKEKLNNLANILAGYGENHLSEVVKRAASGSETELREFIVSNDLWGGAGSIADEAGMGEVRTDSRRAIEAALVELGREQIESGEVNVRTASWVSAFEEWKENGI